MMSPYRPRDYFWDLALPTPRLFLSPFDETHVNHDMAHVERAMERSFEQMSRHLRETMGELEKEATGGFEVKNEPDKLQLMFDVRDYKPEELVVKTHHHALTVEGKHEEKDKDGKHFVRREFKRQFMLPKEVDPQTVVSTLNAGKLMVEAPKKALPPAERMIAIEHKK